MSTHIKTIWHLNITRFWNWEESALQLTPETSLSYVQLNQKEVKKLIKVLENSFDLDKYPSE
jgi:hypothetical protein